MTTSHSTKGMRRYRYYLTRQEVGAPASADRWRVPAREVEQAVFLGLATWLRQDAATTLAGDDASLLMLVRTSASLMAEALPFKTPDELRALLDQLDARIMLAPDAVTTTIHNVAEFPGVLSAEPAGPLTIRIPAALVRRGHELRLIMSGGSDGPPARPDTKLIKLLAEAERARTLLMDSVDLDRLARQRLGRHARLAYLAPDIVSSIIDGKQPPTLTARQLMRFPNLPLAWEQQRRMLGFAAA